MRLLFVAISLAALSTGCGATVSLSTGRAGSRAPGGGQWPKGGLCEDGLPMRVLTASTCAAGICGYSCLPDRWHGEWLDRTQR
jgi:hypothetical protein